MKNQKFSTIAFCIILLLIFEYSNIKCLNLDKSSSSSFDSEFIKNNSNKDLNYKITGEFNEKLECKQDVKELLNRNFNKVTIILASSQNNKKFEKLNQFIEFRFQDFDLNFIYVSDCKLMETFDSKFEDSYKKNELFQFFIIENGKVIYSNFIKPKIKDILKKIKILNELNFSAKQLNIEFKRFLKEENSNTSNNNSLESIKKIHFTDNVPSLTFFINMETYKKVKNNNKALKLVLSFFLIVATSILTFLIVKSSVDWANNSKIEVNKYNELRNQKILDKLCQNKTYFKRII